MEMYILQPRIQKNILCFTLMSFQLSSPLSFFILILNLVSPKIQGERSQSHQILPVFKTCSTFTNFG